MSDRTLKMIKDIEEVEGEDPVKGKWYVPMKDDSVVWFDASSIAVGVVVEVGGVKVEDTTCLRKKTDANHINVAELEAVMKGMNLPLQWELKNTEVKTDSATVLAWVESVIMKESRIWTKGAAEMLIKSRLGILEDIIKEFHLQVRASLVSEEANKANVLIRVRKACSKIPRDAAKEYAMCNVEDGGIKKLHEMYHMGVERMLIWPGR